MLSRRGSITFVTILKQGPWKMLLLLLLLLLLFVVVVGVGVGVGVVVLFLHMLAYVHHGVGGAYNVLDDAFEAGSTELPAGVDMLHRLAYAQQKGWGGLKLKPS